VDELFAQIQSKWIDTRTGEYVEDADVPAESRDERKAAKDDRHSDAIQNDIAGIKRRATYRQVYFTMTDGRLDRIILPVHGNGLWSTMYGFLALDRDMTTVESFAFYEHGETPGLGGEVDNPRWKKSWVGKKVLDPRTWEPTIQVAKGTADPNAPSQVDGLSGATLTARGVEKLVRFWLSDEGYGPLLEKLRRRG
jgi:Na+-transporting NADH:ubiquinone oxidoreductase subunit C